MIVIGITGNLASGKSEAARIFKKCGARVFDADAAARRAVRKGTPVYKAIAKLFGAQVLQRDGKLDRKKLAGHVFSHPRDLKKLNTLIHPGVIFEVFKRIHGLRKKRGILALDVPLLFESRMENLADLTVVVRSSRQNMLTRARKKGLSEELAKKILSTQWPLERKARKADFVIDNNGSRKDLEREVWKVMSEIGRQFGSTDPSSALGRRLRIIPPPKGGGINSRRRLDAPLAHTSRAHLKNNQPTRR